MKKIWLVLPLILGAPACHVRSPIAESAPPVKEIVYPLSAPRKILLAAEGRKNAVKIQLTNNLDHEIPVSSERFAIIPTGRRTLVKWNPASDRSLIPQSMLAPGQALSGGMQFKAVREVVGAKLVYNPRPAADPVYALIKPLRRTVFDEPAPKNPQKAPARSKPKSPALQK